MSLAIVGKVGASIAFLGTSSIVGCVLIKPELFGIYFDVDVYAISVKVDGGATESITYEDTEKKTKANFQCKFVVSDNSTPFPCKVFKLKTSDNTKKQYKINDLNDELNEKTNVDELKSEHKIFKIKFSGKYWDQAKHIDKNIEIIPTLNPENKKYADLKPLFAKHNSKVIGKTNYFVAKADGETISVTTTNTFKCSFEELSDSKIDCTITEFSSAESAPLSNKNYTDFAFTKPTTGNTTLNTITKHKHYLIQFTGDGNKQEIEGFDHKITYSSTGDSGATTTTFTTVSPAVYDSNQDSIFIKSNL